MLDAIICWIRWAVHTIGQTILDVLDFLLTVIIVAINVIISVLPSDPTSAPGQLDGGMLATLNYFVPLGIIVGQFGFIMVAWMLYRLYQWLLRWAKADG